MIRSVSPIRALRAAAVLTGSLMLGACSMFSISDDRYDPAALTDYKPALSVKAAWTTSIGSGSGFGFVPVVVGDAVYAATPNGSVAKIDLRSGQAIWKVSAPSKLSAGVGTDGCVTVVASSSGEIFAFDDSGQPKWTVRATSDVTIPPIVGGGVVVVRSGDYRIQAFDINSGERVWSVQRPGPALALRAGAQMVMTEGLVITGFPAGKLLAISAANGNVQWEGAVAVPRGASDLERLTDVVGAPQLAGALMCAVAYQGRMVCFDVSAGGRIVWAKDFSSASGMIMDQHLAYAPDQNSIVSGFAIENGNLIWKQDALKNRKLTAPAVMSGIVAVGDLDGYVHFMSHSDGMLAARLSVGGGPIVSPIISTPQGLLVQAGNGNLVLISTN